MIFKNIKFLSKFVREVVPPKEKLAKFGYNQKNFG
jgi:hypothetical protein